MQRPFFQESGIRRLAAGGWRLAAGGWRLAAGGWRLAAAEFYKKPSPVNQLTHIWRRKNRLFSNTTQPMMD